MIPFGDLKRQYTDLKREIDEAVSACLDSGSFILGQRLGDFEQEFAEYCGAGFAVGVASGTDALHLALRAIGIKAGDEVLTAANTCVPTVCGIAAANGTIGLVDVDRRTLLMDPADLERRITPRTRAIVPVHLYGQAADIDRIREVAARKGISIVEDAAQAHGTIYRDRHIGSHGNVTCFSFYPSKNLGAFGDGGAVVTDDPDIAERLKRLRNYGQRERYYHAERGTNSRLDELQAAILSAKLPHLDGWNERRRAIARRYREGLATCGVGFVHEAHGGVPNYHIFAIRTAKRSELQEHLKDQGIGTLIHYPIPIHLQEAYRDLGYARGAFPNAEDGASTVLSLPMFPELREEEVDAVIEAIVSFVEANASALSHEGDMK